MIDVLFIIIGILLIAKFFLQVQLYRIKSQRLKDREKSYADYLEKEMIVNPRMFNKSKNPYEKH